MSWKLPAPDVESGVALVRAGNTDINGMPLRTDSLSTRLTKVGAYRRTICAVEAEAYLLRRINGIEEPIIVKSASARSTMIDVLTESLASLH